MKTSGIPPTAVGGTWEAVHVAFSCRLDLNNPPTAGGGFAEGLIASRKGFAQSLQHGIREKQYFWSSRSNHTSGKPSSTALVD